MNTIFFNEDRARAMIDAHERQFGVKPKKIILPMPTSFMFLGVQVDFHVIDAYATIDNERCVHHEFRSGAV